VANRPCVGHHQKYESDTKLFVCLLLRGYRIDGAFLSKCGGPGRSPGPSPHPITPASGARTAAVPQVRWSCRRSAFAPRRGLRTAVVMRNEYSGKYTPRPPLCPSCAQVMRLARTTSRFGNLPDLYTFECRACGLSHIEAAELEAA
jgi:hypothetical protein